MGLGGAWKGVITHITAKGCKHSGRKYTPKAVRVQDLLGLSYRLMGPRNDNTFSGVEMLQQFTSGMKECFAAGEDTYYSIIDFQGHVPKQKFETQKARREDESKIKAHEEWLKEKHPTYVKYSDVCTFSDKGITDPNVMDAETGEVCQAIPFILDEVIRNSTLRKALVDYLLASLKNEVCVPPNTVFYLYYDDEGPWEFTSEGCVHRKDFATKHGEYDITAPRIASYYTREDKPIIFETPDSDIIPILFRMLTTYEFKNEVIWVDSRNTWIDCKKMVADTLAFFELGNDPSPIIASCTTTGNDFLPKSLLAHGFNDGAVLAVMMHPSCRKMFHNLEKTDAKDMEAVEFLVRFLHTIRLHPLLLKERQQIRKDQAAATKANKQKKKNPLDDDDEAEINLDDTAEEAESESKEERDPSTPSKSMLKSISSVMHEYHLVSKHIQDLIQPIEWDECTIKLGKKFSLPDQESLRFANGRVQFVLWYWNISWDLPLGEMCSFEEWKEKINPPSKKQQQLPAAAASSSSPAKEKKRKEPEGGFTEEEEERFKKFDHAKFFRKF